jgi:hypothetical protein
MRDAIPELKAAVKIFWKTLDEEFQWSRRIHKLEKALDKMLKGKKDG